MASTSIFVTDLNNVKNMKSNKRVMTFDKDHNPGNWQVLNDGVMKGSSAANTQLENQALIFFGRIAIDNNSGFTSIGGINESSKPKSLASQ